MREAEPLAVGASAADRWLFPATAVAMVAAFAPVQLPVASERAGFLLFVAVFGGLLLAANGTRATRTRWLTIVLLVWAAIAAAIPSWSWPWAAVPGVVLVLALARDERGGWIGRHRRDLAAYLLAVAGAVVMLPLSFWWLDSFGRTNLLVQITAWQLRDVPVGALPIVVLGFAAVNSFIEELLYRGILLQTLRSWVSPAAAIVAQGVAFGLVHWVGIPGGWFGIAMATAVGVLLGVIRYRTGSILLPWLLHLGGNLVSLGWIAFLLR